MSKPAYSIVALPELPLPLLIAGSLVVAFLAIIFTVYISRARSSSKGNVILLVGDEDAGKSAILSTVIYERTLPTHTSFQVNSALIPESFLPKRQLQVVDVPGHPRLRNLFKTYVLDAKAVVFVVDASTITRNGRDVAEHLHHVLHALTSLPPTTSLPPLLIVAHKIDLLSSSSTHDRAALAISRVRTVLERELEKRRAIAAGGVGVEGLGAEGEGTEMGGLECSSAGGSFRFAEWEGGEVSFVGTSVKLGLEAEKAGGGEKDVDIYVGLEPLRTWLEDIQ